MNNELNTNTQPQPERNELVYKALKKYADLTLASGQTSFFSVDGSDLEKEISGYTIFGADVVDYPLTDGVQLYLLSPDSERGLLLYVGFDPFAVTDEPEITETPLQIELAELP